MKRLRRFYFPAIILLSGALFFVVLNGCSEDVPKFKIFVSGNAHGLIDPCDCELGHLGGLAKRATLFRKFNPKGEALRLETGGIVDDLTDPERLPAIHRALHLLDYTYMLPALQDSSLVGLDEQLPWIDGIEPCQLVQNGLSITIFGFRDDWLTEKSLSILKQQNPQTDLILWITYFEQIDPGEVLVQLKNITPDLILEGNIEYTNPAPDTIQGIPVLRCGAEGMDVLEVDVFRVGEGFQFKPTWHQVDDKVEEAADVKQVLMTQKK